MSILRFQKKKTSGEKITVVTAYDYPSACLAEKSDLDAVLVGDSLAMTVHGHSDTLQATPEMMILHTQAVARGLQKKFLVSDMPFMSYRTSDRDALVMAEKLMRAGANALKFEGAEGNLKWARHAVQSGIPLMGHLGLTPQHVHQLGGFRVQGRQQSAQEKLLEDALALESAGCFAVVLECVPSKVAAEITSALNIPTIGIGAGPGTNGQVLVWHDMLGIQNEFKPTFLRQFAQLGDSTVTALNDYAKAVVEGEYPALVHCYED
jgi:3-methyl-2-oxobutanoate hydroxymethyltransferase